MGVCLMWVARPPRRHTHRLSKHYPRRQPSSKRKIPSKSLYRCFFDGERSGMRGEKSSDASEARDAGSHLLSSFLRSEASLTSSRRPFHSTRHQKSIDTTILKEFFAQSSDPVGRRQKGSAGAQLEPERVFGGCGAGLVVCGSRFG